MGARVGRGAFPLALAALAVVVLWFGLFVAGPRFLRNPPGPNNPSFAWYVAYHLFPLILLGTVALLIARAWTILRRGR